MEFVNNPNKDELLAIDFDQYQRYRKTADLIHQIKKNKNLSTLSILDVGASLEENLKKFLPDDRIFFLDRSYSGESKKNCNFIAGDATRLCFKDNCFDIVSSVDVYEHIPPEKREPYIRELYRVGKYGCIFGAPFDTMNVSLLEKLSNEFYKIIHEKDHVWLSEHIQYGLPNYENTLAFVKTVTENVYAFPNGYLPRWIKLMQFYFAALPDLSMEYIKLFNRFYNDTFYVDDNKEPCYRYFFVLLKEPFGFINEAKNIPCLPSEINENSLDHMIDNLRLVFQMRLKHENQRLEHEYQQKYQRLENEYHQLEQGLQNLRLDHHRLDWEYNQLKHDSAVVFVRKLKDKVKSIFNVFSKQ